MSLCTNYNMRWDWNLNEAPEVPGEHLESQYIFTHGCAHIKYLYIYIIVWIPAVLWHEHIHEKKGRFSLPQSFSTSSLCSRQRVVCVVPDGILWIRGTARDFGECAKERDYKNVFFPPYVVNILSLKLNRPNKRRKKTNVQFFFFFFLKERFNYFFELTFISIQSRESI